MTGCEDVFFLNIFLCLKNVLHFYFWGEFKQKCGYYIERFAVKQNNKLNPDGWSMWRYWSTRSVSEFLWGVISGRLSGIWKALNVFSVFAYLAEDTSSTFFMNYNTNQFYFQTLVKECNVLIFLFFKLTIWRLQWTCYVHFCAMVEALWSLHCYSLKQSCFQENWPSQLLSV